MPKILLTSPLPPTMGFDPVSIIATGLSVGRALANLFGGDDDRAAREAAAAAEARRQAQLELERIQALRARQAEVAAFHISQEKTRQLAILAGFGALVIGAILLLRRKSK